RLRDHRGERAPRPRESRTAADRRALRRPAVSADAGGSMSADTPTPVGPPAPASPPARGSPIDRAYLLDVLGRLLAIRSPSGMTDQIVLAVSDELDGLGIPYGLTRRGAIRADLEGARHSPDRAIVAHLDTLGAMVKQLKPNGRLEVVPIGFWSARFAEGARVTVHADEGRYSRGTILPR